MSAMDKIAFSLDRRDEVPNLELARELAENEDRVGIREIAGKLYHENQNIQSDCLKVLRTIVGIWNNEHRWRDYMPQKP